MKLLIVDDDVVFRIALQRTFGKLAECHQATTGAEALKAVDLAYEEGEPYDVIFMDIVLPDVHGGTIIRRIRERYERRSSPEIKRTQVVAVSGLADEYFAESWRTLIDGRLGKPTKPADVLALLTRLGVQASASAN